MKPIQEIISRIRWDKEFSDADFMVGYYDRVEDKIVVVPFRELYFDEEDHFNFQILDESGLTLTIPLHRIREVYRNGEKIWNRDKLA